jgi:hypothetical protein
LEKPWGVKLGGRWKGAGGKEVAYGEGVKVYVKVRGEESK